MQLIHSYELIFKKSFYVNKHSFTISFLTSVWYGDNSLNFSIIYKNIFKYFSNINDSEGKKKSGNFFETLSTLKIKNANIYLLKLWYILNVFLNQSKLLLQKYKIKHTITTLF